MVGRIGGPRSYYRASSFHYRNIIGQVHSIVRQEGRICRFLVVIECKYSLWPRITLCSSRIVRLGRTPQRFYHKFHPSFGQLLSVVSKDRSPSLYIVFSTSKQVPSDVLRMMMSSMTYNTMKDCLEHQKNDVLQPISMTQVHEGNILERQRYLMLKYSQCRECWLEQY